ncbi:MAG TPA: CpXC domain-containing protein [Pyrinomonadaceae bacterium]|nr:CpXC domain-containing protein [Pyrinomonadaceae bacterium]
MSHKLKIKCPKCGAEMNHHAMKIDYGDDTKIIDPVFDGALKEAHCCPNCGHLELKAVLPNGT